MKLRRMLQSVVMVLRYTKNAISVSIMLQTRGDTPILGHSGDVRSKWVSFEVKNLQMRVNFCPKSWEWAIILIRETGHLNWPSELAVLSILPPQSG